MTPDIELHRVSFSYGGPLVLQDVTLAVEHGEFLGVVGPNGSGKTTLLRLILGLLEPTAGRLRVLGRAPDDARKLVGYVPQFASFERDFPISVKEMVLQGRLGRTRLLGRYSGADHAAAQRAMAQVHVEHASSQPIGGLSGGQVQRALVARALVTEPKILVLDEPTSNIDLRAEDNIFNLLEQLRESMTIVVVSHDIGFMTQYVSRVACLNRTLVCHTTSEVTGQVVEELYGAPVHMIQHPHKISTSGPIQ
ncbi:MAG: ABC transporter ATP-binding protein [Gemmatimonadota bacterium]|nr:MAG: ABC transporter ATP-binding protein [Gemmatimonadota bacterium]